MARVMWREPTEADKARSECRARNRFESRSFLATWDEKQKCWTVPGKPHILLAVHVVQAPK